MFGKLTTILPYYTSYRTQNNGYIGHQNISTTTDGFCLKNIWFLQQIIRSNQQYACMVGSDTVDRRRKLMFEPKFKTNPHNKGTGSVSQINPMIEEEKYSILQYFCPNNKF